MHKFKNTFKIIYIAALSGCASLAVAAGNFIIKPDGTLPTSVDIGQTVSAYFIVANQTSIPLWDYQIVGLPDTVTQNTTDPNSCQAKISLNPDHSCRLRLDISGLVRDTKIAICKGDSCTTGATPLNVTVDPNPKARYIYITTTSELDPLLVCPLNDAGSFSFSDCMNADENAALINTYPQGITINKEGTMAYLSSEGTPELAYQCQINPTTKHLNCSSTPINSGDYYYTLYGMLGLGTNEKEIFIANYADAEELSITRCPLNNNQNIDPDSCVSSAKLSNSSSSYGLGIAINSSKVYASTYSDSNVAICDLANWGSACQLISAVRVGNTETTLSDPTAVTLNRANSLLYIGTENAPDVYACDPNKISGNVFSQCFIATTINLSSGIWSMVINAKNTDAYYTGDFTNLLYHCKVNGDGTIPFNSCETISFPYSPIGMALLY